MSGYDYDADDPSFLDDLRTSRDGVDVVAHWLSSKGYPVVVRPTFERPDPSQIRDYADDGDIEVLMRVEVKRRHSLTFTSKDDFPYPTLIVDACHCYDRANPKPYAYVILNREMDTAFVVTNNTRSHWKRVTKHDRLKNRDRHFYECPLAYVTVVHLNGDKSMPDTTWS